MSVFTETERERLDKVEHMVEKLIGKIIYDYVMVDMSSPEYTEAESLVKDLCKGLFPELYDAVFNLDNTDLIFKDGKYGDYALYYFNPDSNAGGQFVHCPFSAEQGRRMIKNEEYIDVLAENTQYLSDIDTCHYFYTFFGLLEMKDNGGFLGTDVDKVCSKIVKEDF